MAEEVKLVKLFEKVTQADSTEDDIMLTLQITDRMNQRRRYCVEGIEYFKQLFKSTDVKTITKTMNLLEACVKNASIHFHRYVCSRGLIPVFVNVLKRKRKKLSVFEKMGGMYKSPPWRDIEKRALQLIQLWADTFMMDEDKFPAYMNIYRELRKERIDFPARDPNSRFMIKYEGTASPAFELAEMEENQERFEDENPRPKAPQADERERRAAEQRRKLFEEGKELTESDIPNISYADVEVLRANIDKLETATQQAKNLNELLSETNKDIYRKTRTVHKKLIILASVKAASGMDENDTMDLLKINDYISIRIENFKNAMNIYKLGGNQASIHDMLALAAANEDDFAQVPANPAGTGDLVDLGDFLDLGTDNPLDDLERFVTSAFGSQPLPPPAASNTTIPPPPQEEAKQVMALTPPPGLNLLDFDEPTQDQAPPSSSAQPAAPADEFEDFFAELARSNK